MTIHIRTLSSLEKVFSDEPLKASPQIETSALRGEIVSFQIAIMAETDVSRWVRIATRSPFAGTRVRAVELVPCRYPSTGFDDNFLRTTPGLFPDPLLPVEDDLYLLRPNQWQSLWVSVPVTKDCKPGKHSLEFEISGTDVPSEARAAFTIEVLEAVLPQQTLIRSEWFHADCLYKFYNVPCWSEAHWDLLEKYFANAAEHGINMLLTPLWTPPLDTKVGGERPTVQLLDITKDGPRYSFDFAKLERWFVLGRRCGFTHFDFAHAFTQWGAAFTPKVVVTEGGVEKNLFGWHVAANDPEYANFLRQLIPPLLEVVKAHGLEKHIFFHVSDEPSLAQLESYRAGATLLRSLIGDIPVIDAISNIDFYDTGAITIPIPANDHLEAFHQRKIPDLFTYFCVAQWNKVPNRFLAMPSARNRIMGLMLYLYDLTGFLQWGYNFWFTQHSLKQDINPFFITDAGGCFAGGDPFAVYPGKDGPIDSIHHEVFTEGLQDLRALRLLEQRIGRERTLALIHEGWDSPLTMTEYPRDAAWLLDLRRRVNAAIGTQ